MGIYGTSIKNPVCPDPVWKPVRQGCKIQESPGRDSKRQKETPRKKGDTMCMIVFDMCCGGWHFGREDTEFTSGLYYNFNNLHFKASQDIDYSSAAHVVIYVFSCESLKCRLSK